MKPGGTTRSSAESSEIDECPSPSKHASIPDEAWEQAISEFAGHRLGQPPGSLYPLAVGRAALAACRAAYDRWSARADSDLTVYLDAALTALAGGFAPHALKQDRFPGTSADR